MLKLVRGAIFKHYKNKLYLIEQVNVMHTETLERMVVYRQLYKSTDKKFNDYQVWVRPEKMFNEKIKINGEQVNRFEFVTCT